MIVAAHDDHSCLWRRRDAIEQSMGKQEVSKVVHYELLLDTSNLLVLSQDNAGIADQDVDTGS